MQKKKDKVIKFSKEQRTQIITDMQMYFEENMEEELKTLQGELFLDYITENLGTYYYNKGIEASMKYFEERVDDMFLLMKDEKHS